jgi:hypothetical protein
MNWTKELTDKFLKLIDDRAAAETNLEMAKSDVNGFMRDNGLTDETQAKNDALVFKQSFDAGVATVPAIQPLLVQKEVAPLPVPAIQPLLVQNMVFDNGVWKSVAPAWLGDIACLQYSIKDVDYGQMFTVRFMRRSNYPWKNNIKVFRVWKEDAAGNIVKPNWYAGLQVDGETLIYTENLPAVTNKTRFYFDYPAPTGMWREEIWQWKANSALGAADGWIKITIDGKVVLNALNWQTDDSNFPGVPNHICIQDDPSNFVMPADAFVEIKDIQITSTK